MKILLIGASLLALGVTSAAAQQQPAPTLPPADTQTFGTQAPGSQAPAGAAAEGGIWGTPASMSPTTGTTGPTTAQAQTPPPGQAQRFTETGGFSLGGLYGYGIDDSDHMAGLNLTYDYGLNPGLGLQLEQAAFWNLGDGIGGRSVAGLNLNLGDGQGFVPYIGGNLGAIYGNGIEDSWVAGPEIGLKLGVLDAKVAYDMPFNKSWDRGTVIGTVGLGLRF
jgi:opacity protein-like surface antigen